LSLLLLLLLLLLHCGCVFQAQAVPVSYGFLQAWPAAAASSRVDARDAQVWQGELRLIQPTTAYCCHCYRSESSGSGVHARNAQSWQGQLQRGMCLQLRPALGYQLPAVVMRAAASS
jgi:hypothetical protein